MAERPDFVFQAKLAEQAERYDGKARMSQGVDTAECPVPFFPPPVFLRRGLGDAGKPFHMDLLGERQNGGVFSGRLTSGRLNNSFLGTNGSAFYLTGRSPCGVPRCLVYGQASRLHGGRSCSPDGVNLLAYTR